MIAAQPTREELLTRLYLTAFPTVAALISRQGGTLDEAKDIFQDALVVFYERSVAGNKTEIQNEKAYLIGIAKHLWYHHRQKESGRVSEDVLKYIDIADEQELIPSGDRLLRYLEMAGKRCMNMLEAFYYDRMNMTQLARRFGLSGERSATVQKHKCLEKVRDKIKEKALTYEDLCN